MPRETSRLLSITGDPITLGICRTYQFSNHEAYKATHFLIEIRPTGVGQTSDSLVQPFLVFLEGPFLTVRVGLNVKVDLCLRSPEKWYQIQELIYEKCFPKMSLATIYDLNCL